MWRRRRPPPTHALVYPAGGIGWGALPVGYTTAIAFGQNNRLFWAERSGQVKVWQNRRRSLSRRSPCPPRGSADYSAWRPLRPVRLRLLLTAQRSNPAGGALARLRRHGAGPGANRRQHPRRRRLLPQGGAGGIFAGRPSLRHRGRQPRRRGRPEWVQLAWQGAAVHRHRRARRGVQRRVDLRPAQPVWNRLCTRRHHGADQQRALGRCGHAVQRMRRRVLPCRRRRRGRVPVALLLGLQPHVQWAARTAGDYQGPSTAPRVARFPAATPISSLQPG